MGSIQVLSDMHTDTSLEYHVVDVVRRNATVSVSVVSAGAATAECGLSYGQPAARPRHFSSRHRHSAVLVLSGCGRGLTSYRRGLTLNPTALLALAVGSCSGHSLYKTVTPVVYDLQFQRQQAVSRHDWRSSESLLSR